MSEQTPLVPDLNDRRTRLKYKMAEARQELVTTLRNLQPEDMDRPTANEGWTVRHVAAHIAAAEGSMEIIARRILERDPKQREMTESLDLARFNESMIRRRSGKSIEELIEELNASRERSLQIIEQASEEDLDLPGLHPAYGEVTLYGLFVVIYRHEQSHARDIKLAIAGGQ